MLYGRGLRGHCHCKSVFTALTLDNDIGFILVALG